MCGLNYTLIRFGGNFAIDLNGSRAVTKDLHALI